MKVITRNVYGEEFEAQANELLRMVEGNEE